MHIVIVIYEVTNFNMFVMFFLYFIYYAFIYEFDVQMEINVWARNQVGLSGATSRNTNTGKIGKEDGFST